MRIVFATPVPPVTTKPRPHYFLRGLAERGHEVHVVATVSSLRARDDLSEDPSWADVTEAAASIELVVESTARCALRVLRALPSGTPLRVAYCDAPRLAQRVRSKVRAADADVLHVDRPRLGRLLRDIPVPKLLDATDSLTAYLRRALRFGPLSERAVALVELPRMPRYEARMVDGYEACIVTAAPDARELRASGLRGDLEVVPNGVDHRFIAANWDPIPRRLVFVGNMNYAPNVAGIHWFARRVLPLVKREHPHVTLDIVGNAPRRSVRRLARDPAIEVSGWVPDVIPHLERAAVFVAPLQIGGGFPNKVAEAFAVGVPVVATTPASSGVTGADHGQHLLRADSAEAFADSTCELLSNEALADELRAASRELIAHRYTWDVVIDRLETILSRIRSETT